MLSTMTLIGNVGQPGELKVLPSGTKVTKLRVAVNDRQKDTTTWFTVTCWGQKAEYADKYVKKGDAVYASGRLEVREYEKRNGDKAVDLEVHADAFKNLGKRVKFEEPATPARMPYKDDNRDSIPF